MVSTGEGSGGAQIGWVLMLLGGQGLLQEREESNPPDSRIKNREMGSVLLIGGRSARELSGSPSPGSQACLPV